MDAGDLQGWAERAAFGGLLETALEIGGRSLEAWDWIYRNL